MKHDPHSNSKAKRNTGEMTGEKASEEGSSMLEVLIAMAILMILMVGVLSMFSMAYLTNVGAAARTDMTYKAQQVADVVRYLNFIFKSTPTALPTTTGLTFPLTAGTTTNITSLSGSGLTNHYWGPATSSEPDNANILDPNNMQYTINVSVTGPNATGLMTVTVAVVPNTDASNPGGKRYLAKNVKLKEVDYVTQLLP